MTGYVLEKIYYEHDPGPNHPESPERLKAIAEVVDSQKSLKHVRARSATEAEICLIHSPDHFAKIKATQGLAFTSLDPDTQTSARSFEAACWAVGGVLNLIDSLFAKEINNGFAFVRPPGHHAERDRAMGFCLFNNIAIGAAYAIKKYKLEKILILDLDLHHGNGTQHAFYDSKQVLYISTHQFPYYPGTGSFEEIGEGKGQGYNLNFPLSPGKGDDFYNLILEKIIVPVTLQYQPRLILISMGFDTYYQDPLGGMKVTAKGYAGLANQLIKLAEKICQSKVIFVLEGGYNLTGIKEGTKAILEAMGKKAQEKYTWRVSKEFQDYFLEVKKHFVKYWHF